MVSFKFIDAYTIYPGSVLLFTAVLFAVLLIYIKEGVASAQALIFGIIISNLLMSVLFGITYSQELTSHDAFELNSHSVFIINYKYFITGTLILLIDFFLLIIIYQFLISQTKKLPLFLTLFISLFVVLIFDSLAFNISLFYGTQIFKPSLISHLLGKSVASLLFSIILYLYLKFIDTETEKTVFIATQQRNIFSIFNFRKKYLDLKIERKEVEQKLNTQLNNTLNNISDGFVSLDTNWCYSYINKKGGEFLGRTPSSLIGKHIWTEFPDGVGLPFYNAYYKAVETQQTQYFHDYYKPFDKWFENRIYPSSEGLSIYFTDITEQKKAEKIIIQKEQELNIIYQTSTQPIFIIKVEGGDKYKFISVSNSFLNILNITEEEVINKSIRQIIPEPSLNLVLEKYKEAIKSKNPVQWEETTPYNNGVKTAIVTISPLIETTGYCTHLVGIINDITEQKKTELALIESENHIKTILETEPECIKQLSSKGELLYMNPAGLNMIEADSLEMAQGQSVLHLMNPNHQTAFKKLTSKVFKGFSGQLQFEITGLKGTKRWLESHAVPFKDVDGKIISLLSITRDITEQKKNEIELRKYRNQLEDLVKVRTEEVNVKNAELQRMNKLFVGRELKMKELKKIIKEMQLKNDD